MPKPSRLTILVVACGTTLATWSSAAAQERTGRAAARVRIANPFTASRFTRYTPNWLGLPEEQEVYPFSFGNALSAVGEASTEPVVAAETTLSDTTSAEPSAEAAPVYPSSAFNASSVSPQATTSRPPFRPRVRSPFRPPPRPPF